VIYALSQPVAMLACTLFFRIRVWGVEHVPREGGVLLASNHGSFADPLLVAVGLPRQVRFLARRTLFASRLFGAFIRAYNAFPVERGSADLRALRAGIRVLSGGAGLVVFPEATRTPDGRIRTFKPGFALMAARAGVPVVPVGLVGNYEAWPRRRRLPRPGRVHVAYGEPVWVRSSEKADCVEAAQEVQRRVEALYKEFRQHE
jgi:1-acyl-sn-glycerol-3-phosphate acyltransferase